LTLSIYVTWTISRMQETHGAHNHPSHSEVLHVLAALSSIAITYAALAFLYKVIPNARVRLRSALLAAFVAGSAWEVAKFLFAWASGRMVQVHRIYGSVAVLPITLTWIYISWFIALIGCPSSFRPVPRASRSHIPPCRPALPRGRSAFPRSARPRSPIAGRAPPA